MSVIILTGQGYRFQITDLAEEKLASAVNTKEANDVFLSYASHVPPRHRNGVWQEIEQQEAEGDVDTGGKYVLPAVPSKSYDDVQRERREAKQRLATLQPYTVVGYWVDNGQSHVGHVEAIDVDGACLVARDEAGSNGYDELAIVAVFDGHHADLSI